MAKTNRYNGNTGKVTKYRPMNEDRYNVSPTVKRQNEWVKAAPYSATKKQNADIWILAVFFLLYLESRDSDFLIILAVLAFSMFEVGEITGFLKAFAGK